MPKYLQKDMRERWASAGNVAIPSSEKTAEGWVEEIPPSELANYIENRQDESIAYLMQQGIPEWLNNFEYQPSSFIQYNGVVYKASATNINQQPNVSPEIWQPAFDSFGVAAGVRADLDELIAAPNPYPQYLGASNGTGFGNHTFQQIRAVDINVDLGTPSAGNPRGYTFGSARTTGFYRDGTTGRVTFQFIGAIVATLPNASPMPSATADNTLVTAEWVKNLISSVTQIKVGGLHFTTNNVNPSVELGYGTWQKYAEGRAIVGHSGDVTTATPDWVKAVGNTEGSYTHTLTSGETPVFSGAFGHLSTTPPTGVFTQTSQLQARIEGGTAPSFFHRETTMSFGGGLPHNNVQPSIVVFIWRRTA